MTKITPAQALENHFNSFVDKCQKLFSKNSRSRHVVLTDTDKRMMYIMFTSKILEHNLYHSHKSHMCFIFDRHNIVHIDINSRCMCDDKEKEYTTHAEVNAIKSLIRSTVPSANKPTQLNQSFGMLIIRFSKTGKLNNSRPCYYCARFIKKHINYFHSISFSTQHEDIHVMSSQEFLSQDFDHKTQRYLVKSV